MVGSKDFKDGGRYSPCCCHFVSFTATTPSSKAPDQKICCKKRMGASCLSRHQIKKSAARKEWVRPVFQVTRSRNLLQEKNGCVLSFKAPDQEICCKKRKEWVRPVFQGEARRAHDHYHNLSDILVHYRTTHKSGRVKQR